MLFTRSGGTSAASTQRAEAMHRRTQLAQAAAAKARANGAVRGAGGQAFATSMRTGSAAGASSFATSASTLSRAPSTPGGTTPAAAPARVSSIRPHAPIKPKEARRVMDVVIPLEADLDGDPDHDDVLRLRAVDGSFEKELRSSAPDVAKDPAGPLLRYRFRDVPEGRYELSVKMGDAWWPVAPPFEVGADAPRAAPVSANELGRGEEADTLPPAANDAPQWDFQDFDHDAA